MAKLNNPFANAQDNASVNGNGSKSTDSKAQDSKTEESKQEEQTKQLDQQTPAVETGASESTTENNEQTDEADGDLKQDTKQKEAANNQHQRDTTQAGWEKNAERSQSCDTAKSEQTQSQTSLRANDTTSPEEPAPRFEALKKEWNKEKILELIPEYTKYLLDQQTYDTPDVLTVLKNLHRIYLDRIKYRHEIGVALTNAGFADAVKKMTIYFNRVGVFKSDDVWFPCYYTLNALWNFTDSSAELAKAAADAGMVHYYLLNLSHEPYLENRKTKNVTYVLKSSLSTLNNILRLVPECKPLFAEDNGLETISRFLQDEDEFFRVLAIFNVSALISEEESAKLEDNGSVEFIVRGLKRALSHTKRRYRGFSVIEMLEGLDKIAANDANKQKIVDAGALEILVSLLSTENEDEIRQSARTIWTLCFDEYSKTKVVEYEGCVDLLEKLSQSENESIKKAASGALWKIRREAQHKREQTTVGEVHKDKHIFISYNHEHKDMVHQVKDKLKADGFKVWIDTEQMGGSTLEAMAHAVENAYLVLVCASERYKLSPNCRTEGEYIFQLKKPIVPLMVQRRFKPDGWLGMLLGAKLYINFDGKFAFDVAYKMLLKEMDNYIAQDHVDHGNAVVASTAQNTYANGPSPPTTSYQAMRPQRTHAAATWTKEQVHEWVSKNITSDPLKELMNSMDGKMLVAFDNMRFQASEFFYSKLTNDCAANMLQLCELTSALDQLP